MDVIDRRIIAALQDDGRMSATELAERVSLSLSATSERLRRLVDQGVIAGFTAMIDPALAGRPIQAVVDVRFQPGVSSADLVIDAPEFDAVVDALHLTGRFDVQLRVSAADVGELDRLLQHLKETLGAEETNTRLVLRTIDGFPRPLRPA